MDTWYCLNMFDPGNGNNPTNFTNTQQVWPFRKLRRNNDGTIVGQLSQLTHFKNAGSLAILFDGVRYLDADVNRINARHNKLKLTNVLFADGHCESIDNKSTPELTAAQMRSTNLDLFKQWPHPHWRLDQR